MAGNGLRRRFALGLFAVFGVLGGAYALALPAAEADDDPGPAPSTTTSAPCLPPASFDLFGNCVVHPTMPTSTTTPTTLPPGTPAYVAGDDTDTTTINDAIEIDVIANDVPPAGYSPSTLNVTTEPAHGLATVHDSEFLDYEIIEYAPDFGFEGIDSLEYESCVVKAGAAPLCDRAVVTVTVFGSDMPPSTTPSTTSSTVTTTVSPTTIDVEGGGTVAPTAGTPTTVLVVEGADATSTSTATPVPTTAQLPFTGGSAQGAWLGVAVLAFGGVVALGTRSRRRQA
jgi:hypothetical protein